MELAKGLASRPALGLLPPLVIVFAGAEPRDSLSPVAVSVSAGSVFLSATHPVALSVSELGIGPPWHSELESPPLLEVGAFY